MSRQLTASASFEKQTALRNIVWASDLTKELCTTFINDVIDVTFFAHQLSIICQIVLNDSSEALLIFLDSGSASKEWIRIWSVVRSLGEIAEGMTDKQDVFETMYANLCGVKVPPNPR